MFGLCAFVCFVGLDGGWMDGWMGVLDLVFLLVLREGEFGRIVLDDVCGCGK